MKTFTITSTVTPPLVFIAWLLVPQTAHSFYNPSTGRWISRDPVAEVGFVFRATLLPQHRSTGLTAGQSVPDSAYSFVHNSPCQQIDGLGLYSIDEKKRIILVAKCEIVILYGHGGREHRWTWKMSPARCNGGAVIMCAASANTSGLDPNLVPIEEKLDAGVWWGGPNDAVDDEGVETGGVGRGYPNAALILQQASAGALTLAKSYCGPGCCCAKVNVRFIRVGKTGVIYPDPVGANKGDSVPNMRSYTYDCATKTSAPYDDGSRE